MKCTFLFIDDEKPFCMAERNQGCRMESGYTGALCSRAIAKKEKKEVKSISNDTLFFVCIILALIAFGLLITYLTLASFGVIPADNTSASVVTQPLSKVISNGRW